MRQDTDLGRCEYESVTKERYDTVRERMETYDWTDRYHLIAEQLGKYGYGICISWVASVLLP